MAAERPDRYLVNMAKAKRTGRIFLDYLRNDRMSDGRGPLLAPRPRRGAGVVPLTWNEVKPGLDPKALTLRTAPALLKKTKAWADYDSSERLAAGGHRQVRKKAANFYKATLPPCRCASTRSAPSCSPLPGVIEKPSCGQLSFAPRSGCWPGCCRTATASPC